MQVSLPSESHSPLRKEYPEQFGHLKAAPTHLNAALPVKMCFRYSFLCFHQFSYRYDNLLPEKY